jgi:hypothetical protein
VRRQNSLARRCWVAESDEEAARCRFRWSEGSTRPRRSSQWMQGRWRGVRAELPTVRWSWQRAAARCRASPIVGCGGERVRKVHVTPALLEKARLGQEAHRSQRICGGGARCHYSPKWGKWEWGQLGSSPGIWCGGGASQCLQVAVSGIGWSRGVM